MGDLRISPATGALGAFLLGVSVLVCLLIPDVLGMKDVDEDGISDTFQNVTGISDLIMTPSGEWKEVSIGYTSTLDIPFTAFVGSLLLLVLPVSVYLIIREKPRRKEDLTRKLEATAMHDNVRRMASFLSANPSLPNAVRLSHMSQKGGGERVIGQVIWESRTRGVSIEEVLLERSRSLDDGALSASLEGLVSAEGESSFEDVRRSCDLVVKRLGEDLKEKMTYYASSLRGPSTALFGLGVLLPVLLATMIPLAGFSIRTVVMIGFLLWVVVPVIIVRTGTTLVLKRPLVRESASLKISASGFDAISVGGIVSGLLMMFISMFIWRGFLDIVVLDGPFPDPISTAVLLLLIGSSMIISSFVRGSTMEWKSGEKERNRDSIVVADLLSEIGSRVMEGRSFERALEKGYERIGRNPPLRGMGSGDSDVLSRSVDVAREYSRAGSRTGGTSIKALSSHVGEMARLSRSMKELVRSSVGQMETTASVFAPIMIGISVGIFELMGRSSGELDGGMMLGSSISPGDLSVPGFILLSGVYLMVLSVSSTLTLRRLEEGNPSGGWERVPRNLILSSVTFASGVAVATLVLGG
jgi:hypothetical protein